MIMMPTLTTGRRTCLLPTFVVALLMCVLCASCWTTAVRAANPVPKAVDFTLIGNKNADQVLTLRASLEIQDNGELNAEINVPAKYEKVLGNVTEVGVSVRGLYHEHAGDLQIELLHGGTQATLVNQRHDRKTYGKPFPHPHPNSDEISRVSGRAIYPPANPIRGDGYRYTFRDSRAKNLALYKNVSQSTVLYEGVPGRAVDGNVNGFFSSGTVTHTAGHGDSDSQPWWQVDLGKGSTVGTVKVWNRQQEPNIDEVQAFTTTSAEAIQGSFKLSFTNAGVTRVTGPIHHAAVASVADEIRNSQALGTGLGESVQAKLQALKNVGTVEVVRSAGTGGYGTYSWTISFLGNPGNLEQLSLYSNEFTSAGSNVVIETLVQGNGNGWYNYRTNLPEISKRLFPCWVMIMPDDPAVGLNSKMTLAEAKKKALYKERLLKDQRETAVSPRYPIKNARYVRVQLEDSDYLSLAEVQVFSETSRALYEYRGGSPIAAGMYHPEQSLNERFTGKLAPSPVGSWILQIHDHGLRKTINTDNSKPERQVHGQGAIDDWTLHLYNSNGTEMLFRMDLSVTVQTLPRYGTLYHLDPTSKKLQNDGKTKSLRGDRLQVEPGLQRYLSPCYGDCKLRYGTSEGLPVGVGNLLSTDERGSIAGGNWITPVNVETSWDPNQDAPWDPQFDTDFNSHPGQQALQKVPANWITSDRQVVYAPNKDFLGRDFFTYTLLSGVTESSNVGTVGLHVRKCRLSCDNEVSDDGSGGIIGGYVMHNTAGDFAPLEATSYDNALLG